MRRGLSRERHCLERRWQLLVDRYERCTGCRECESACPVGAIFYVADGERVIKCDTCGGDPLCARVCPTGALTWEKR